MALPHYSSLAVIAGVHPTAAETEDENWGIGGQREFDEDFKCRSSALDGIELPGTVRQTGGKGHRVGSYNHSLLLFVDKAHVSILVPLEVMSSIRAPWESPVLICCQRAGCSSMDRPFLDQLLQTD